MALYNSIHFKESKDEFKENLSFDKFNVPDIIYYIKTRNEPNKYSKIFIDLLKELETCSKIIENEKFIAFYYNKNPILLLINKTIDKNSDICLQIQLDEFENIHNKLYYQNLLDKIFNLIFVLFWIGFAIIVVFSLD